MRLDGIFLEVEAIDESAVEVFEVRIGGERNTVLRADIRRAYVHPAGVLVKNGKGVVVALIDMTAAELDSVGRIVQCGTVVDELRRPQPVLDADIGFAEDIPAAQVPGAGLAEGKIQFKLPRAQAQRISGQLQEAADVDEPEVAVAQSAIDVSARHADVVIHPEGYAACRSFQP